MFPLKVLAGKSILASSIARHALDSFSDLSFIPPGSIPNGALGVSSARLALKKGRNPWTLSVWTL
jgi:hypothetical protein